MQLELCKDPSTIARLNEPVQTIHFELYPERFKAFDFEGVKGVYENVMKDTDHYFLVCKVEDEPVGYVWFQEKKRPENAFMNASHTLYIHQISVNRGLRGQGIGRQLMAYVHDFAKKGGIKRIGLDYWVKNSDVKYIYEKIGYTVEREVTYLNLD